MITASELARRAGVSRQAIGKLKDKFTRIVVNGKTGYDENSAEIISYIKNASVQRIMKNQGGGKANGTPVRELVKPEPSDPRPEIYDDEDADEDPVDDTKFFDQKKLSKKVNTDSEPDRADYETRKMKAQAEQAEIKNRILRNEYLPRDSVKQLFGKIFSVHANVMRPLDAKIGNRLAAEMGITDPEKILRVQELISAEVYPALQQIKKLIDDYLDSLPGVEE